MIAQGVAFDTETYLIRPGCQAPPVVCLSWTNISDDRIHAPMLRGGAGAYREILDITYGWLTTPGVLLIGANTAYDALTLSTLAAQEYGYAAAEDLLGAWFHKYDRDEVTDVLTRQKMLDLSAGCYRGYSDAKGFWHHHGYGLDDVQYRYSGKRLEKDTGVRLRYGELANVSMQHWPREAIEYPLADAVAPALVAVAQEQIPTNTALAFPGLHPLRDQFNQTRSALWLKLCSVWGIRTNPAGVDRFAKEVEEHYYSLAESLIPLGLAWKEYKLDRKALIQYIGKIGGLNALTKADPAGGPDRVSLTVGALSSLNHPTVNYAAAWNHIRHTLTSTDPEIPAWERVEAWEAFKHLEAAGLAELIYHKSTKAAAERMKAVCYAANREVRVTDKGNVSLDKETCDSFGDEHLKSYAELSSLSKTMSTDLAYLRDGAIMPIHTRFEEYLDTSRTSSSAPNIQNIRRLPGQRECFIPRPGYLILDADYRMLELHTLAQICLWLFGYSRLAEALNAGRDPHTQVAATMLRIPYKIAAEGKEAGDDVISNHRDCGKVGNFGFPGGLGPDTLMVYAAKSYGVKMTREQCVSLKHDWSSTWIEMPDYFAYVNSRESYPGSGSYNMVQPWSGRLRADATFCAGCNDGFQGLGASVAKRAGWYLVKAMYANRNDPLYGCRMINFIHDQFLLECPEANITAAGKSLEYWMNRAAIEILPDVRCTASVLASKVWSKKAKRIEINGVLLPWEPKEKAA